MLPSAAISRFAEVLSAAFPDVPVEQAKTVQRAVERVAAASGRPLIVLTPGRRDPAQLQGSMGNYGRVLSQQVMAYVAMPSGIARRGETEVELADFVTEVESALLTAEGDFTDVRFDGSEPATLPDGYPLEAWLIRVSLTTD